MRDRFIKVGMSIPIFDLVLYLLIKRHSQRTSTGIQESIPNDIRGAFNHPGQKWVVKTAVPRNSTFMNWGDYHFAQEVIASLRKHGQEAFIAFRGDENLLSRNDVNLVIRGLIPHKPILKCTNLIWVISHPSQLSKREIKNFDFIFAASAKWAKEKEKKWKLKILFLPQATNPTNFHFNPSLRRDGLSFVGNSVNRKRKIVEDIISLGYKVRVYGKGWEGKIPKAFIASDSLSNLDVAKVYANSCVVLNDHWPDMKQNGFLSNRVYDGVASGATVISDQIEIDTEIPNLYCYENIAQLRKLVEQAKNACESNLVNSEIVEKFGQKNSFDERVKLILRQIELRNFLSK